MATSRVPDAIDAIVTALVAADLTVYDGPEVADPSDTEAVYVGWDGDPDTDEPSVTTTQQWTGPGSRTKNEDIAITCAAVSWGGDTAVKARRDAAYALFAAVEDALRPGTGPNLGLPPPTVFSLSSSQLHQEQTDAGLQARLIFTISVSTRI